MDTDDTGKVLANFRLMYRCTPVHRMVVQAEITRCVLVAAARKKFGYLLMVT